MFFSKTNIFDKIFKDVGAPKASIATSKEPDLSNVAPVLINRHKLCGPLI